MSKSWRIATVNKAYCLFLSAISFSEIFWASAVSSGVNVLPSRSCCLNSSCFGVASWSWVVSLAITPSKLSINSWSRSCFACWGLCWAMSAIFSIAAPAVSRLLEFTSAAIALVSRVGAAGACSGAWGAAGCWTGACWVGCCGGITDGGAGGFTFCVFTTGGGTGTGACCGAGVYTDWVGTVYTDCVGMSYGDCGWANDFGSKIWMFTALTWGCCLYWGCCTGV